MEARVSIDPEDYRNIVILTGAGISVASGIRPYRGPDGLWNDESLVRFADHATFLEDPLAVWRFWWKTREVVLQARPNAAHEALAALERSRRPGQEFTLITQNIDGLHREAGSKKVVEYHGRVMYSRCSREGCGLEPFLDEDTGSGSVARAAGGAGNREAAKVEEGPISRCPRCSALLRPDIVMFGEPIPAANRVAVSAALSGCDLFVAIGTSATVYPANQLVSAAARAGARTIYVNLESLVDSGEASDFGEEVLGRAEETVPRLFAAR
jgi:NAD-dependent deacetylase